MWTKALLQPTVGRSVELSNSATRSFGLRSSLSVCPPAIIDHKFNGTPMIPLIQKTKDWLSALGPSCLSHFAMAATDVLFAFAASHIPNGGFPMFYALGAFSAFMGFLSRGISFDQRRDSEGNVVDRAPLFYSQRNFHIVLCVCMIALSGSLMMELPLEHERWAYLPMITGAIAGWLASLAPGRRPNP